MDLKMLSFQKSKGMAVVQFMSPDRNTFDYISGPDAIKNQLVQVKETSESGNVNKLFVFNLSDKFVFFMDGDILTGAKQNRVLNTSVLLAPNSKVSLSVSCVEQGRWSNHSPDFFSSDYIAPAMLRAKKAESFKRNIDARNIAEANQMGVWDDVREYSVRMNVSSATGDLHEVFESQKKAFDELNTSFTHNEDANGAAIFYKNKLLCADLFNRTNILNEYFPKLIRSAAMEIAYLEEKENPLQEAEAFYKTLTLFDSIKTMVFSVNKGMGAGEEKRFSDNKITGFKLDYEKYLIHLTALNLEPGKEKGIDNRRNRVH